MHLQRGITKLILQINSVPSDGLNEREGNPSFLRFTGIGGAMIFSSFRGSRFHAKAKHWRSSKQGIYEWLYFNIFMAVIQ